MLYTKGIQEETTINSFTKDKFHITDKIRNRIHLNNCKLINTNEKYNKMFFHKSSLIKNNTINNNNTNDIMNSQTNNSYENEYKYDHESDYKNDITCNSSNEYSSWILTSLPESDVNIIPNIPYNNISTMSMYSPIKNSKILFNGRKIIDPKVTSLLKSTNNCTNSIIEEYDSTMINPNDSILIKNNILDKESKLLRHHQNKDHWNIISKLNWVYYCIRDLIRIYKQLSSYLITIKNSEELFENISYSNPLGPIFKIFRLLYAIILYIECKNGDSIIDNDEIITKEILFQFENALLINSDYQFRSYEITMSTISNVINERNETSLITIKNDSDQYLDDLMIECLNADTIARKQAIITIENRIHKNNNEINKNISTGIESDILQINVSIIELIQHIIIHYSKLCTFTEFHSYLESRNNFIHLNPLYQSRHTSKFIKIKNNDSIS